MRVIGQSCQLARIDFLGAKKRAAAKYGRKCPKTWKVIILGFLEGSHGRMIANKEREWAHIGYWRRQDTIIGLNCSTPPQTETPIAALSPWLANNFQAARSRRRSWICLNRFAMNQRQKLPTLLWKTDQIQQMISLWNWEINCGPIFATISLLATIYFPIAGRPHFIFAFLSRLRGGDIVCGG